MRRIAAVGTVASTLFARAAAAGLSATFTATLAGRSSWKGSSGSAFQRGSAGCSPFIALVPAPFAVSHGGDGGIGSLLVLANSC
jgi:hypothetical protein